MIVIRDGKTTIVTTVKTEELKSGKWISWYEGYAHSPFAKGETAEQAENNLTHTFPPQERLRLGIVIERS